MDPHVSMSPHGPYLSYSHAVAVFMQAMDQLPAPGERFVPPEALALGKKLVQEEVNEEFFPALERFKTSQSLENATELLDAICDSIYVLLWVGMRCNLPVDAAFLEVQRSNMAKLGPDGKPQKNPETGKVLKPAGWTPPDIATIVRDYNEALNGITYVGGFRNGA